MNKKVGVYICHCGGNISDYVDVESLQKLIENEENVVVSKHVMFACSDSTQNEMIEDIRSNNLDAIVVASCSPKLHTHTFRGVAERAGLNKYNYIQVNIREQCSWAHSDNPNDATIKAAGLIRGGIKKAVLSKSLENIEINAHKSVLVIGAGVSGLSAAIKLAEIGNHVYLIEKESRVGGKVIEYNKLIPSNQNGKDVVSQLLSRVKDNQNITLFTETELEELTGSIGNFSATIVNKNSKTENIKLDVGSVLVTSGFDHYKPKENEFGFGLSDRIITINELQKRLNIYGKKLMYKNKPVNSIAFIYCVGNRQSKGENKYCSRTCCSAAINVSLQLKENNKNLKILHLYRDIRTYGKQEILYEKSSKQGDIYLKFEEKDPPIVEVKNDTVFVKVKDYLTQKKEIEFSPDILVLVTGAVAREDSSSIASILKIPIGNDKFFNEIHPKLKPVETVINGIFIAGSCQGPKNISESVQSSLSAVSKIAAITNSGVVKMEPIIAEINADLCSWCGKCAEVCEYDAIKELKSKNIAEINNAACVGCGICAPACPKDAIHVKLYSNAEVEALIDGFMSSEINISNEKNATPEKEANASNLKMKKTPDIWQNIIECLKSGHKTIPEIAQELKTSEKTIMWNVMTMNKYKIIAPDGLDKKELYYYYKLK